MRAANRALDASDQGFRRKSWCRLHWIQRQKCELCSLASVLASRRAGTTSDCGSPTGARRKSSQRTAPARAKSSSVCPPQFLTVSTGCPMAVSSSSRALKASCCGCSSTALSRLILTSIQFRPPGWNEIVVDGRGNTYVNGGAMALITPDGTVRKVAEGFAFPNGMAVTPDNSTLIVAESHAHRLTAFEIA